MLPLNDPDDPDDEYPYRFDSDYIWNKRSRYQPSLQNKLIIVEYDYMTFSNFTKL